MEPKWATMRTAAASRLKLLRIFKGAGKSNRYADMRDLLPGAPSKNAKSGESEAKMPSVGQKRLCKILARSWNYSSKLAHLIRSQKRPRKFS